MMVLDISVIAAMQAGYIGGSALFVAVADQPARERSALRLKWLAPQVLTMSRSTAFAVRAGVRTADRAPPRHQPIAVVLDLMHPIGTARQAVGR